MVKYEIYRITVYLTFACDIFLALSKDYLVRYVQTVKVLKTNHGKDKHINL